MEILVTIIAFWLIFVGAYGAYSLTQERSKAPRLRTRGPVSLQGAMAGGSSPFSPVSLPIERVPSFIARFAPAAQENTEVELPIQPIARETEDGSRFRAEAIIAARLAAQQDEEAEQEAPVRAIREEEPRMNRPEMPRFEPPVRPQPTEVDFLRAQVEHLRSEIYALSETAPRQDRPKQRRYRTGNYTQMPRTLRRQVNEARGVRRIFSNFS